MTKQALKRLITRKFKTISNFGRCAGIDRIELQKFFARDTRPSDESFQAMEDKYKATEFKLTGNVVEEEKLEVLRGLLEKEGGVHRFCKANRFDVTGVYKLFDGKPKRKSKLVNALFGHFKIE